MTSPSAAVEAPPLRLPRWRGPAPSWALLLLTGAPWGATGQVTGSFAALKTCAFLAALVATFVGRRRGRSLGVPEWLLIAYATTGAVGAALSAQAVSDSLTRSVRMALVVASTAWIASRWTLVSLMRTSAFVATSVCAIALLADAAGLSTAEHNRLTGYLPPLGPNSLGAVAGIGATVIGLLWVRRRLPTATAGIAFAILAATLVKAESRTALIATGVGVVVVLAMGERKRIVAALAIGTSIVSALSLAASLLMTDLNPLQSSRFHWDSSFSGRTLGWARVVDLNRTWTEALVGQGLALKFVRDPSVPNGLRLVDGSWHSAYLETGWLGLSILAVACLLVLVITIINPQTRIALPVLAFLMTDSTLESDLNDVTFPFVMFVGIASIVFTVTRQSREGMSTVDGEAPPQLQSRGGR